MYCRNCHEKIEGENVDDALRRVSENNEDMFLWVHSNESVGISMVEPFCSFECLKEYMNDWEGLFEEKE